MEPHPVYGDKLRVVQELVPGKQITLAHIIANPQEILYRKLGLDPSAEHGHSAIGIVTLSRRKLLLLPLTWRSRRPASSSVLSTGSAEPLLSSA